MPGTDALHSALIGTNVHVAHRFTYADAAAREAATPTASDVGCLALQEDNHSLWLLVDDDPLTWARVSVPSPEAHETALKANYAAGELDSEAEVIAAINATNTTVNSLISKLETLGLLETS
jgi:hypothetical protein